MAKYFYFHASYSVADTICKTLQIEVEGYISSEMFTSYESMIAFLKGYYHPSIHVVEEENIEEHLTEREIKSLSGEGFDSEWMKGRASLYEWIEETAPDGYKNTYFSGRQPVVERYLK